MMSSPEFARALQCSEISFLRLLELLALERKLQARRRSRRGNGAADRARKPILHLTYILPDFALAYANIAVYPRWFTEARGRRWRGGFCRISLHRELRLGRRHRRSGTVELLAVLIAARRPTAVFDTERRDRYQPRMRRQQQVDRQHAVLAAAFHDVAGLDEHLVNADILHCQFVDAAGLANLDASLGHGFLQGERSGTAGSGAVHQINCEIAVNDRTRDARAIGGGQRRSERQYCNERRKKTHECSAAHGNPPK